MDFEYESQIQNLLFFGRKNRLNFLTL